MPDHTKVNLKQVKDMAPQFGMPDGLHARFAREDLGLEDIGMTYFTLAPDLRIPFGHKHEDHEEVYVVLSGSARIKVGDEILDLEPLDAVHVPGDVMRALEGGPDGAEVIAFGQRAGQDQSTMEPGWWTD